MIKECFNDWGSGDTTILSPGRSPKQPFPGIGLHYPLHGRPACPEFISFHQGVGQISPRVGRFSCRPLPKLGQICDIPAPQSLNDSKLYCFRSGKHRRTHAGTGARFTHRVVFFFFTKTRIRWSTLRTRGRNPFRRLLKSYEVNFNVLKQAKDGSVSELYFLRDGASFFVLMPSFPTRRFVLTDGSVSELYFLRGGASFFVFMPSFPTRRRGIVTHTYESGGTTSLTTTFFTFTVLPRKIRTE